MDFRSCRLPPSGRCASALRSAGRPLLSVMPLKAVPLPRVRHRPAFIGSQAPRTQLVAGVAGSTRPRETFDGPRFFQSSKNGDERDPTDGVHAAGLRMQEKEEKEEGEEAAPLGRAARRRMDKVSQKTTTGGTKSVTQVISRVSLHPHDILRSP